MASSCLLGTLKSAASCWHLEKSHGPHDEILCMSACAIFLATFVSSHELTFVSFCSRGGMECANSTLFLQTLASFTPLGCRRWPRNCCRNRVGSHPLLLSSELRLDLCYHLRSLIADWLIVVLLLHLLDPFLAQIVWWIDNFDLFHIFCPIYSAKFSGSPLSVYCIKLANLYVQYRLRSKDYSRTFQARFVLGLLLWSACPCSVGFDFYCLTFE